MRKVKVSSGKEFTINPLSGGQVRQLREQKNEGFDETFVVAKMVGVKDNDIDEMPFPDLMAIHKAVLAETFGLEEEAKN